LILELVLSLKLRAIGNSMGFSLPKAALSEAGFDQDGEYELLVSDGAVSLERAHRLRRGSSRTLH